MRSTWTRERVATTTNHALCLILRSVHDQSRLNLRNGRLESNYMVYRKEESTDQPSLGESRYK